MLNSVKDFGAVGDGVTDDRAAIQAAIDHAVANGKGGILLPAGIYRVSRVTAPGGRWSLDLNNVQDFLVMGEGPGSVVQLVNTTSATGEWHVFILRKNCRRVVFKDLVIDGNRAGLAQLFSLEHDFPSEWHRFVSGEENFVATIKKAYFPYFVQSKQINTTKVELYSVQAGELSSVPTGLDEAPLTASLQDSNEFEIALAPDDVLKREQDARVFLVFRYAIS